MIVILTIKDDVYVPDIVIAAVAARGHEALRVDSDDFPGSLTLSVDDDGVFLLTRDGVPLRPAAVWARRRWPASRLVVDARYAGSAAAQARTLFHAWLRDAGDRVVNAVDAEDRAEDKVLQLRLARRLGFTVPATLVGNDPAAVRRFVKTQRDLGFDVVTKLLVPLVSSMQATRGFFYTSLVDDDALAHVDDVVHAPQIFQRRLDKALELRVQVVGDHVFCGALVARARDWRLQTEGAWQHHTLPAATHDRCLRLCRALGLVTGAIDLVVDAAGIEHFLEVNPAGEWGFLERDLGLPIADALAEQLVKAAVDVVA